MNEKFFSLPAEKQQAILNAGYHVFARNSYKKSPMSEIAEAAGISKALLFHYFYHKKERYLYLLDTCAKVTNHALEESGCYEEDDLFEILFLGIQVKINIMRQYPDMGFFSIKAFYENDAEVAGEIQKRIQDYSDFGINAQHLKLDQKQFRPGIDLEMMYWDMYWASEGYLWEKFQQGDVSPDEMKKDFRRLVNHWKNVYQHKGMEGHLDE